MKLLKTSLMVLVITVLAAGCAGSGDAVATDVATDESSRFTDGVIDTSDTYEETPADLTVDFAFEGLIDFDLDAVNELDTEDTQTIQEGAAGWPCDSADDCLEAFCIYTANGKMCTQSCEEECPFGWLCLPGKAGIPDQMFICAPTNLEICNPCQTNDECSANGVDGGQKCVVYGAAGNFCGSPCVPNSDDCPPGYFCQESEDVTGALVTQCVADESSCECSQLAKDTAATTDCYVENEWGVCTGLRHCMADGLTECSAILPAPETCNLFDDNCDGGIDEETGGNKCFITNQYGACEGLESCLNGTLICSGDEPMAELCDGKDNDCDGEVDEKFPDTDNDGTADCLETDKDGDAIPDGLDNCPSVFNPSQDDTDLDSMGNACDLDDDNDLVADDLDCAPLDTSIHPGAQEICDGKDNDCNNLMDEGFTDSDFDGWKDCVDEDDDNDSSPDGEDCAPLDADVHPSAIELCNGLDDNCNLEIDEGYPDLDDDDIADCTDDDIDGDLVLNADDNCPLVSNPDQKDQDNDGTGDACDGDADGDGIPDPVDNCPLQLNPQQNDIDKDGLGDACDPDADGDGDPNLTDCGPLQPAINSQAVEICDGLDNNCSGEVDDDLPTISCGKGVCAHTIPSCINGSISFCDPYEGVTQEECDGLDNDCNGLVDEAFGTTTCGKGICLKTIPVCKDGEPTICDPQDGATDEICDGLDNDCDGKTDEELPLLACGKGQCFHTQPSCIGGVTMDCEPFAGATPETCDGQDNDCDGEDDEDLGATTCGFGQCEHTIDNCADGVIQICNPFVGAAPESCDTLDNDCDSLIDEDLGLLTCGQGICQKTVPACVNGEPGICDPLAGASEEACGDGLDNDCDGEVDVKCGPDSTGTCLDKLCCDLPCEGPCVSCKQDGSIGTCLPYPAGTDPDDECGSYLCDGTGPGEVGSSVCFEACTEDDYVLQCDPGFHCDEDVCTLDLEAGDQCDENSDCGSGYCRTDWDGDGMFCALGELGCVDQDDESIVQHDDGHVECDADGPSYRICTAGQWLPSAPDVATTCGAATCAGGCGYIDAVDNLCVSGTEFGVTAGCEFENLGGAATTCVDCGDFSALPGSCAAGLEACSTACGASCQADELDDVGAPSCWLDDDGDSWQRVDICTSDGMSCTWFDDGHDSDTLVADCGPYDCVAGACLESCDLDNTKCNTGFFCGPDDTCLDLDGLAPWEASGDYMVLTKVDATYFAGSDCPGNFFGQDDTTVAGIPFRVGPYISGAQMAGLTAGMVVPAPFNNWQITTARYIFPGGRCKSQPLSVTFTYSDDSTASTGTASIAHDCSDGGNPSGENYAIQHMGTYNGACCDHWYIGAFTNPNPDKMVVSFKANYSDGCGGTYNGQLWALTIE